MAADIADFHKILNVAFMKAYYRGGKRGARGHFGKQGKQTLNPTVESYWYRNVGEAVKRLLPAMLTVAIVLVALLYVPFLPRISVDLKTTTVTNACTSVVATEMYQAWMTVTILWFTTTMQVGGRTATIPIPYTAIVSDAVRTYTSRTTIIWREVTTATYSSGTTRYEALAQTHPILSFLLMLALIATSIMVYLLRRGIVGEDIA